MPKMHLILTTSTTKIYQITNKIAIKWRIIQILI